MLKAKPSAISKEEFMKIYGNIYEHSPWIAERAWESKFGPNIDDALMLHAAMKYSVAHGTSEQQMALVCAHPDLACEAGELTPASNSEQAKAGLKNCSPEELAEFTQLNRDYKAKFGFPFIVAVRGHNRQSILEQFRKRIHNDVKREFATAVDEIHKIAFFRLEALEEETTS